MSPRELLSFVCLTRVVLHNHISLLNTKKKRQVYLAVVSGPPSRTSAASSSWLIGLPLHIATQHHRQSNETKAYINILSSLHLVKQPFSVCGCWQPPQNSYGGLFCYNIGPLPKPELVCYLFIDFVYSPHLFDSPHHCSIFFPYITVRWHFIPMRNNKLEIWFNIDSQLTG